jgi:hypothetical protein
MIYFMSPTSFKLKSHEPNTTFLSYLRLVYKRYIYCWEERPSRANCIAAFEMVDLNLKWTTRYVPTYIASLGINT